MTGNGDAFLFVRTLSALRRSLRTPFLIMNFEDTQLLRRPVLAPTEQSEYHWCSAHCILVQGGNKGFGETAYIKNDPADGVCRIVLL